MNNQIIDKNYNIVNGEIFDINNVSNIIERFIDSLDSYGANTTIFYLGSYYKGITQFSEIIPVIKEIHPDDYILIEINLDNEEIKKNINFLSFTMYSYEITNDNITTTVFASIDQSLQFYEQLSNNDSVIKICITSSKIIAKEFESIGYLISKISLDLLPISNFNYLIRVGVNESVKNTRFISNQINTTFFQYLDNKKYPDPYYFDKFEIIDSWPVPYLPFENDIFKSVQAEFKKIKYIFNSNNSNKIIEQFNFFPYLSNIFNTNYAFQNVYDALTVYPPAQLQANDTGKSYFLTDSIDFSNYPDGYIYILALNHNASNVSLTSNIQIYEAPNFNAIENGTLFTGPNSTPTQIISYPIPSIVRNDTPTYNLFCYSCKNLLEAGVNSVFICERIQYSLANFYHIPTNIYNGTASVFILNEQLNEQELYYLNVNYNINVDCITIPIN